MDSLPNNPSQTALVKAEWQNVLFDDKVDRLSLLRLKPSWPCRRICVHVHRNHSYELLADIAGAYFAYADLEPAYVYSDYDDSLSLSPAFRHKADLELIWLDFARYPDAISDGQISEWLRERLVCLRNQSEAPILIVPFGLSSSRGETVHKAVSKLAGVHCADLTEIEKSLGTDFYDLRAARYSGTRLSDIAMIGLAREIACRWVPALVGPIVKAIAVDMDHTLYKGVLGEDGIDVKLLPGHVELQCELCNLRGRGLFLALVSRNDPDDVQQLLRMRSDFPLRRSDFTAAAIGWSDKSDGLERIAQELNIGTDSLLLVDDNPGELAAAAAAIPGLRCLHAHSDPRRTLSALRYVPGLWRWKQSRVDALRVRDLEANRERQRQRLSNADPMEYLRSLKVSITIELTPRHHLTRLHELSQKTNQFNAALQRYSEAQLASLLEDPRVRIASISLHDRLMDSGVVGLVVGQQTDGQLVIEEIAISCRALGRGLEDLMLAAAINAMRAETDVPVAVRICTGPRNAPARNWLQKWCLGPLPDEGLANIETALRRIDIASYPVKIQLCK